MSLLLITKRGTGKKITDEIINSNWAGTEFKNFQEERKEKILFRRRKTIISSSRGTKTRYLEKTKDVIPKPKQKFHYYKQRNKKSSNRYKMKAEKIIPQLSKSKVFLVKLGFAAIGMTLIGLYLFADYI